MGADQHSGAAALVGIGGGGGGVWKLVPDIGESGICSLIALVNRVEFLLLSLLALPRLLSLDLAELLGLIRAISSRAKSWSTLSQSVSPWGQTSIYKDLILSSFLMLRRVPAPNLFFNVWP